MFTEKRTLIIFLICCIVCGCNTRESDRYIAGFGAGDHELKLETDRTYALVDSLIREQHPGPAGYIDSLARFGEDRRVSTPFQKYIALRKYYYDYQRDFALADIYADSTLQLFDGYELDPDYTIYHLYALQAKSDVLRAQQLYGASVQYLLRGWQWMEPEKTPCMAAEYLAKMGSISYIRENYRNSIDFYKQAVDLAPVCRANTEFSMFRQFYQYYHNVASNYFQLQMPDSALHFNNLALALIEELESSGDFSGNPGRLHFLEVAKGVTYGNMGTYLLEAGQGEKAGHFWERSIAINEQPGYASEHAELTRLRLADYYIDTARETEAERALQTTRNWLDHNTSREGELRWRRIKWKLLHERRDTTQAYEAFRQYTELKEQADQSRIRAGTVDLAAQIRLSEQQQEITRLQSERQLRDIYLGVSALFILLVVLILFLLWYNWRRSKKQMKALADLSKQVFHQKLQLEKGNREMMRIMNMIAHDLKNPLAGIKGLSSFLLEEDNLTEEQCKWLELMHDSSTHAIELLEEVMTSDFSEMQGQDLPPPTKTPVAIKPYLQRCIDLLQFRAMEKKQTLLLELGEDEDSEIPLNRNDMFRVLGNLVGNAIKFSEEGKTILLKARRYGKYMRFSVKDEGIGIPDNMKNRLFKMFTDVKRNGTAGEQSFGLGLYISKRIVEAHGGSIGFDSKEGEGSEFFVDLPFR